MLVPFGEAAAAPLVTLPLNGTTQGNGMFTGTLAITAVQSDGHGGVFVEGIVSGTVTQGNKALGTALSVPVRLPLTGNWGQVTAQRQRGGSLADSIVLAQAQSCGVLHLEIGAVTLNILGVDVTTAPIMLDLSGDSAGPLGALVCALLGVVGTVANLINLLTQLLGGLGGALGAAA
jgi:hypothetical protein